MFEDILKSSQERWLKFTKELISDLQDEYNKFWETLIKDLSSKKITLEDEVGKLEKEKSGKITDINSLSQKLIQLNAGVKKAQETTKKYEVKQSEMLDKITAIEAREVAVGTKENELKEKEEGLTARESGLENEIRRFDARQKKFKQYFKEF